MAVAETDCSICLQQFVHPVELPCGHIFCFLCIKGCALHRRRCPMCRGRFSIRFFEDPKLVNVVKISDQTVTVAQSPLEHTVTSGSPPGGPVVSQVPGVSTNAVPSSSEYRWFYEGFAGWWQYDERTSAELESAFLKQLTSYDVQIAGFIYTIDFVHMTQKRQDNSGRKRRIKRDLKDCDKKGIAGIKLSSIGNNAVNINNNNNSVASSSSQQLQPNQSCADPVPVQPEPCTASSSTQFKAPGQPIAQTRSLSQVPDSTVLSCTPTSTSPTNQPAGQDPRLRTGRTRDVVSSNRNASLSRHSPSPTPHNSRSHLRRSCNGVPGSRVSRSVPRYC